MTIALPFNFNPQETTVVSSGSYTPATGKYAFVIPDEKLPEDFEIDSTVVIPQNYYETITGSITTGTITLPDTGNWHVSLAPVQSGSTLAADFELTVSASTATVEAAPAGAPGVGLQFEGPLTQVSVTVGGGTSEVVFVARRKDVSRGQEYKVTEGIQVDGSFSYMEYNSA